MSQSSVKRLKNYFDELANVFGNPVELTKSAQKIKNYYQIPKAGVKSDFIRIYTFGAFQNNAKSFAFSFIKPEEYNKSLITVTLKDKDVIISGMTYSFEEFKVKFKEFLKIISILKDIKNFNSESVETTIKKVFEFEKNKLDTQKYIADFNKKLKKVTFSLDRDLLDIEELLSTQKSLQLNLEKAIEAFASEESETLGIDSILMEINLLKNKLKPLRKELEKRVSKKREELKINSLQTELRALQLKLNELKSKRIESENNLLKEYPLHVQMELKNERSKTQDD